MSSFATMSSANNMNKHEMRKLESDEEQVKNREKKETHNKNSFTIINQKKKKENERNEMKYEVELSFYAPIY